MTVQLNEKAELQNRVNRLANELSNRITYEEAEMEYEDWCGHEPDDFIDGFDYLSDMLDIEYTISSDGVFLGARILVSFGGPNIWIDTRREQIEGYWWGDSAFAAFTDVMDLHGVCRELYEMRA